MFCSRASGLAGCKWKWKWKSPVTSTAGYSFCFGSIPSFFLVISPLISSSILGTYWPGEFLFQYPIISPFHSVHGILKVRILKWKPKKVKVTQLCPTLCNPMDYTIHGILQARILEWVAFPFSRGSSQPRDQTQVSHIAGEFFNQLSHQGSPRILEWVAYPFSRGSSQPRNRTRVVSCIAGRFFTYWAIRELNPSLSHDRQEYSTTILRGWQSC